MLKEMFPRIHARYSSLMVLGPEMDGFVVWLHAQGYPAGAIRYRMRQVPRLDAMLRRGRVRRLKGLAVAQLRALAPRDSRDDVYLSALVRSLARYLDGRGFLAPPPPVPGHGLLRAYRSHLEEVRGLAASTVRGHLDTAREFLASIGVCKDSGAVGTLGAPQIEAFIKAMSMRWGREGLQHVVAHIRSFLRFLARRGEIETGLADAIDSPRIYHGERLPRSLPWKTVQDFVAAIDRSTGMGLRDYAMFLLIATYGLRRSEVAGLRLDDIEWRAGRLRVPRPKMKTPIVLPLTEEVGAALVDYLRHGRPVSPDRAVFLRVRVPGGPIGPTAVSAAFRSRAGRGRLPIPFRGPHCLRHSLAVHLLRQGAPLKTIGDVLGHRLPESTCDYLRLQVDDLREAALDVPRDDRR